MNTKELRALWANRGLEGMASYNKYTTALGRELPLLLDVVEAADAYERWCCGEGPNHDAEVLSKLRSAVRAYRAAKEADRG